MKTRGDEQTATKLTRTMGKQERSGKRKSILDEVFDKDFMNRMIESMEMGFSVSLEPGISGRLPE